MCYFIYGSLYGDIDKDKYDAISAKYEYKIRLGTKHAVKMAVKNEAADYRVTNWCCDCDGPICGKNKDNDELLQYEALFNEIKNLKGVKHIYFCKTWAGSINKREITVDLKNTDIRTALAEMNENNLYTFVF